MMPASIGIFDSGIGGLSILQEIRKSLPEVPLIYFADQAHVPYGSRSLEEVHTFAAGISRFLIQQGSKVIVVACNTASAAALHSLRSTFPQTPFVGMEPAVKPAALTSQTRKVGVLATPTTFQGKLFASVVERFAKDVVILQQTLPGMVELIEHLELNSPETQKILTTALGPLLEQGVDTLVLACTHYPFVMPLIKEIAGPSVQVIDPSPAIARQTQRIWEQLSEPAQPQRFHPITYYSTGDPEKLASVALQLIQLKGSAKKATWDGSIVRIVNGD